MKLRRLRVTNYKSVEDSGEFTIGDLTCLAGKNESGKTAILQALWRLNPVEKDEAEYDRTMEFPRSRLYDGGSANEQVIDSTWEMSDDDVAAVESKLGSGSVKGREVTVIKGYGSPNTKWTVQLDEQKVIQAAAAEEELTAPAAERVAKHKTVAAVRAAIEQAGDKATIGEKALVARFGGFREGSPALAAIDVLNARLPRFLYFATYEAMPGRIAVEDLVEAEESGEAIDQADRIFLALLSLAETSLEEVRDQSLSEALIARLEGVSNLISREIFRYWSQNRHLKVRFDYREALEEDPETGHVFLTRVENTRHGVTVGFDERSAGFVWFFSFLVWFSQAAREYGENLVILLDEPGLSLHGTAQADLLRYIKERLLPKHQVVYTTHSPFMIDASDLFTVRTVEDVVGDNDEILGTKVGDEVLSTDPDTVFPLRAVLGYEITQTLFVGEHTLLVEGPSDFLYLRWASSELRARGGEGLDLRWVICPTGGIDKIASFIALFGGNKLDLAVLTDYHAGDKAKVTRLRELEILRSGRVFSAEMYTGTAEADVEDLLGREFYAELVNAAYALETKDRLPTQKPAEASEMVVQEVAKHMLTVDASVPQFDHYAPAAYLVEHWPELKQTLPGADAALERFEALFRDVNKLL